MVGGRVCLQVRNHRQRVEASILKHCNGIVLQVPAHIVTHGPTNAPPARRRPHEKEQRCVLNLVVFCFLFPFSWGREREDTRLRCVRAKSGSAFFFFFLSIVSLEVVGSEGERRLNSYNVVSFESVSKAPVSSCVIALPCRSLNQQRAVDEELQKMCGRESERMRVCVFVGGCAFVWVRVDACARVSQKCGVCVYDRNINNMCTLNPISI